MTVAEIFQIIAGVTGSLILLSGVIWMLVRQIVKTRSGDRAESEAVMYYKGMLNNMAVELTRQQAEVGRLAQASTNNSTRVLQLENEAHIARQSYNELANIAWIVKRRQEAMIATGQLKDPLVDIHTNMLTHDPLGRSEPR